MLGWEIVRNLHVASRIVRNLHVASITTLVDNSFSYHFHSLDIRGGFFSVVSVATGVPGSDATGTPDSNITSSH